ncbi:MAG: glycoside hydrolase family 97 protein [Bacteroidota bacterium]
MKKIHLTFVVLLCSCLTISAKDLLLTSPDKSISVTISIGKDIKYSIDFREKKIILPSALSMTLTNGTIIGTDPQIIKATTSSVDEITNPLYGIKQALRNHYNELKIDCAKDYSIIFRVYNEGFAYRFVTNIKGDILIKSEQTEYHFADNYGAFFHPILSESDYRIQKISDYKQNPNYSSLPLLVKGPNNLNILLHESDLFNYPSLTVAADSVAVNTIAGVHAAYPKKVEIGGYNNYGMIVKTQEPYISKTVGKRSFPWRLIAFEEQDKDILTNQLVYLLATPSKLSDESWIKPGKVAWDWWNALNLSNVKFKTGFNTATYKYYIDFAAANHLSYINLDDGWSDPFDLLKPTKDLDMEELISYAHKKNVGVILWCVWHTLNRQMIPALDMCEKWGIAGLKVDFMDRDDQVMIEFHERLLKEAAKRKLLVDFHGAFHPSGMSRTYPNNINVEGVKGLEWNKFDKNGVSPQHDVSIPFIRMFAGSMDYTPGAMQNYNQTDWKQVFNRPTSQGTRCHQLAMYVVYYAPLEMLADAPTAYQKEPQVLNFLSEVPTVWDDTVPIEGKVGEFLAIARRKGTDWYVGAMTNWTERELNIRLNFLEPGKKYQAEIFTDGINANRVGSDYDLVKYEVKRDDHLKINMAKGGGWVCRFKLLN